MTDGSEEYVKAEGWGSHWGNKAGYIGTSLIQRHIQFFRL